MTYTTISTTTENFDLHGVCVTNPVYAPNPIVNSIYTTSTTNSLWSGLANQPVLTLCGDTPTIKTDRHSLNVDELAEFMNVMKERMLVLTPNFEKHELYPALKQAYDNYKLIERMLSDGQ